MPRRPGLLVLWAVLALPLLGPALAATTCDTVASCSREAIAEFQYGEVGESDGGIAYLAGNARDLLTGAAQGRVFRTDAGSFALAQAMGAFVESEDCTDPKVNRPLAAAMRLGNLDASGGLLNGVCQKEAKALTLVDERLDPTPLDVWVDGGEPITDGEVTLVGLPTVLQAACEGETAPRWSAWVEAGDRAAVAAILTGWASACVPKGNVQYPKGWTLKAEPERPDLVRTTVTLGPSGTGTQTGELYAGKWRLSASGGAVSGEVAVEVAPGRQITIQERAKQGVAEVSVRESEQDTRFLGYIPAPAAGSAYIYSSLPADWDCAVQVRVNHLFIPGQRMKLDYEIRLPDLPDRAVPLRLSGMRMVSLDLTCAGKGTTYDFAPVLIGPGVGVEIWQLFGRVAGTVKAPGKPLESIKVTPGKIATP